MVVSAVPEDLVRRLSLPELRLAQSALDHARPQPVADVGSIGAVEDRSPLDVGQTRGVRELVVGQHRAATQELRALPGIEQVQSAGARDTGVQVRAWLLRAGVHV